jgi:hypothetical protein
MKDQPVGRDRWARRESLMASRISQVGAVIPNRPLSAREFPKRAVKDNGPYLTTSSQLSALNSQLSALPC